MVLLKMVFTGQEQRNYSRATTTQRVLRVSGKHNDLEEVGRTPRHHTLFEMMGNFSFGDYFKRDAITMAWDLLINHYKLDVDRLWVTIFEEDDESGNLWKEISGLQSIEYKKMGAKDNSGQWEIQVLVVLVQKFIMIMDRIGDDPNGTAGETDRYAW